MTEPTDWHAKYYEAMAKAESFERKWSDLVETTATRIAQGEESRNPHPAHYKVPGMDLDIVDIIKAKARVSTDCWQFLCWAEAMKHLWRYDLRGCAGSDLNTAMVYVGWLKDSVKP